MANFFASAEKKSSPAKSKSGNFFADVAKAKDTKKEVTSTSRANRNEQRLSEQEVTPSVPVKAKANPETARIGQFLNVTQPFEEKKVDKKLIPVEGFSSGNAKVAHDKGNFLQNLFEQAKHGAQTAVASQEQATSEVPSTGNKLVDTIARETGSFLPGLATGQTELKGLQAAKYVLPKVFPEIPYIINKIAGPAAIAGIENAYVGAGAGQTSGEQVATNLGLGAGAGGLFGAIGEGIGATGRAIARNKAGKGAVEEVAKNKGNWFTNLFGDQNVGITPFGKKTGKAVTSEDVIVKNGIKKETGNILDSVTESAKATHRNLVDRFAPLKKGGLNVKDIAEDATRANQIANNIIGKEFVTPEGKVLGEGLETLMKSVPRGRDKTLFDYLLVKDAQARVPRGERVYDESIKVVDPTDPTRMRHIELNSEEGLAARRAQLEERYPWLPAMSDRWNAFTKNLRETYGVNEGLLSTEMNDALVAARPDYIKMNRQFTRSEKPGRQLFNSSSSNSFSGKKAPIKSVSKTGSARNIIDPRKTMAESVGAWVNNAMRNRVGQELVNNILNDPQSFEGIARIVPESPQATQNTLDEINKILQEDGIDGLAAKLHDEFQAAFGKGKSSTTDNQITVMMNGKPVKVEILDPELALSLQGLSPSQLGLVLQVAKFGSDFVKRSATGVLAPAFAAKSAIVDLPTSLIQAKGNRARFLGDYVHALASGFASKFGNNRLAQLAKDYERAGGGFSAALKGEKALNKAVKNLERNPILSGKNLYRTTGKVVKAPFKISESIANVFENAPRIAANKGELRRLGGEKTADNVRRAMKEGREITVDYSKKGRVSDELEAISPYTNAAIQGISRVARQIKDKPIQTLAGITAVVGIPKAYEYIQFHDDPDYKQLPAREKFRNLIISKNDDGTFNKVPLEPSYAAFGAAALDFYQYVKDNDPDAFKGMSDSLANAFLPPLASGALQGITQGAEGAESPIEKSLAGVVNATSAAPAASIFANQSFTGAPIDSKAVEKRSPQYKYDEKTSSIGKWLGKKLNFSPMKVDYLLKQYGGDLARIGLPTFSDVGSGTRQQTLLRNFIVDPVLTNNLTNDYYTGKSLLETAEKDNADVDAPLPDWYDDDLRKELTTTKKGSITAQLKALTDEKKEVNADKSLTAAEKSQKIRGIQRKINNIYIDVNAKMKESGVPFPRR